MAKKVKDKELGIEKVTSNKRSKEIAEANKEVVTKFGEKGIEKFKLPEGK